jgi:hypothetical protein
LIPNSIFSFFLTCPFGEFTIMILQYFVGINGEDCGYDLLIKNKKKKARKLILKRLFTI